MAFSSPYKSTALHSSATIRNAFCFSHLISTPFATSSLPSEAGGMHPHQPSLVLQPSKGGFNSYTGAPLQKRLMKYEGFVRRRRSFASPSSKRFNQNRRFPAPRAESRWPRWSPKLASWPITAITSYVLATGTPEM